MKASILTLLLTASPAFSAEMNVSWTNPTANVLGHPFIPGEYLGVRITYSRSVHETYTRFIGTGESVRISGLKKGWWDVFLESVSQCHIANGTEFITEENCFSDPTPTLRVKAQ